MSDWRRYFHLFALILMISEFPAGMHSIGHACHRFRFFTLPFLRILLQFLGFFIQAMMTKRQTLRILRIIYHDSYGKSYLL
ncbi:MAG: hypothetical protein A4E28_00288 [Methanocella sp. PtaU1.Bin125]|nr:MAG: hypothetical protein A4E28_00288 [Methanocella sp. PtaU1.Bin125]